ncbi:patatin family protein [Neolewinella agarilytica]|uniref:patatin-like phospholipase family protein n=1 Tax=Neolewinella agarilytica TaxID=478744 RepID=UPI002355893C|nr:patatin family protein [Neolewinella agarilytica]
MNEAKKDTALIIEGGGFKSAFTTGILDAFQIAGYRPFNRYIGVSGGAIALSYFLSDQYRFGLNSLLHLTRNEKFTSFSRTFSEQGFMDLDIIAAVAREKIVFDLLSAMKEALRHPVHFVATDELTGKPAYLQPTRDNWLDAIIASSALPFFTKGRHEFEGRAYIDGGCSDPIPLKWAYEQGVRKALVLRTWPETMRFTRSWSDVFGGYYYRADPIMKRVVDEGYAIYNACADYADLPPKDLKVTQLSPHHLLETGTYINTPETIMHDYGKGLDAGLAHIAEQRGSVVEILR